MAPADTPEKAGGSAFWKIAGAGASFQAGSSAIDASTVVAGLVNHLTGNVYAVGAATAPGVRAKTVWYTSHKSPKSALTVLATTSKKVKW